MAKDKRVTVFLSLGTNVGDRSFYLQEAVRLLEQQPEISITHISSIYETDPVGYLDQASFLNIVVQGETSLPPQALLQKTQDIENKLGRERLVRWGPRTIDIDILLYNNKEIVTEDLMIPHPRMQERAFVMVPLAEIAPDLRLPGTKEKVSEVTALFRGEGVRKWNSKFKDGEKGFELLES